MPPKTKKRGITINEDKNEEQILPHIVSSHYFNDNDDDDNDDNNNWLRVGA